MIALPLKWKDFVRVPSVKLDKINKDYTRWSETKELFHLYVWVPEADTMFQTIYDVLRQFKLMQHKRMPKMLSIVLSVKLSTIFHQIKVTTSVSGVDDFCGIYSPLPKRCFVSNTEMLFSCPVIDTAYPYVIDIITGDDKIIKNVPNFDVIDVHDGLIVGNLHAQLKKF